MPLPLAVGKVTRSPLEARGRPAQRRGCRRGSAGSPGSGSKGRNPWNRTKGPRRCGIFLGTGLRHALSKKKIERCCQGYIAGRGRKEGFLP